MIQRISPKAFDLIVRYETGGKNYYRDFLQRPTWPGGASGVTIGFGYDLGYESTLAQDWSKFLSVDQIARLQRTRKQTGSAAKQALSGVRDIVVKWDDAAEVFNDKTLPQEIRKTLATFPGADKKLSANAFGALVSLVFNRGTYLTGDRRREMKAIADAIQKKSGKELHEEVSRQFLLMRRLWPNTSSDQDLYDRRTDEAKLVLEPD